MSNQYEIVDPLADAPDNVDMEPYLRSQGWEDFMGIGDERSPLYIQSWRRKSADGTFEYMVDVWNINYGSPYLKVNSFPELMDLLAKWAPAVQAASVAHLIDDVLESGLSDHGTIERIAAKMAFGTSDVLPRMRRQEAEQEAARQRQREARRVAPPQPAG